MLIWEPTEAEEERLQISVLSTSSLPREQSQPASHLLSSKTKVSLPHPPALFLEAQLTLNECPETQVAFSYIQQISGRAFVSDTSRGSFLYFLQTATPQE